jgi:hypothetical protein
LSLRHLSFGELWAGWGVYWTLVFAVYFHMTEDPPPRALRDRLRAVGDGAGPGAVVGAAFAALMWLIIGIR